MSRREDNATKYIKVTEYEGVGWIPLDDHGVSDDLLKKVITLQFQSEAGNINYETISLYWTSFLKVNFRYYAYFVLTYPNL
jgi:hypothetical protein